VGIGSFKLILNLLPGECGLCRRAIGIPAKQNCDEREPGVDQPMRACAQVRNSNVSGMLFIKRVAKGRAVGLHFDFKRPANVKPLLDLASNRLTFDYLLGPKLIIQTRPHRQRRRFKA